MDVLSQTCAKINILFIEQGENQVYYHKSLVDNKFAEFTWTRPQHNMCIQHLIHVAMTMKDGPDRKNIDSDLLWLFLARV